MDELLSLKWNNHCSTFLQILSNVRTKQKFTDVTLGCAGKFYNVHRIVLSSCSDYFSEIFESKDCKNLVVLLKDIRSEELEALLDYMYIGEVNVKQADLSSLIKAAEFLQVKGLAVADEEPLEKVRQHKNSSSSPRPKRKRKLDEQYSSNTSPPAKIKTSQACTPSASLENVRVNDKVSDSDDVKNIVIKEENLFQPEVFAIEDDELEDYVGPGNSINTETKIDPLKNLSSLPIPSTSEIDKNLDESSFLEENLYPDDGSYSGTAFNEDSNDWQGDDSEMGFTPMNYGSTDPSNTSPMMNQQFESLQCPHCSKIFPCWSHLERHMRVHTEEKPILCKFCPYIAGQKCHIKWHMIHRHNTPVEDA